MFVDVFEFRLPSLEQREDSLRAAFGEDAQKIDNWLPVLTSLWEERSFSDLTRTAQWIRRRATTKAVNLDEVLLDRIGSELRTSAPEVRKRVAALRSEERRVGQEGVSTGK